MVDIGRWLGVGGALMLALAMAARAIFGQKAKGSYHGANSGDSCKRDGAALIGRGPWGLRVCVGDRATAGLVDVHEERATIERGWRASTQHRHEKSRVAYPGVCG